VKRRIHIALFPLLAVAGALCLAGCHRGDEAPADFAVTSSYLECAIDDVLGGQFRVLRLAEPGMCPGHFDVRPSQVRQIRSSRMLVRFDFQGSLDRQVGDAPGPTVVSVSVPGGMCEPASYLAVCQQVADACVAAGLVDRPTADARLTAIEQRLDALALDVRRELMEAGLAEAPVIASGHQAAFCRWLGLNVVAALGGADVASVRQVDAALKLGRDANCRLVIANRPEGTALTEAIADRLNAGQAVFENFPAHGNQGPGFDQTVRENVRRLIAASRP